MILTSITRAGNRWFLGDGENAFYDPAFGIGSGVLSGSELQDERGNVVGCLREDYVTQAKAEVDAAAEARRVAIWLTPGSGQSMEYTKTERQARAAAVDPNPLPENYGALRAQQRATFAARGVNVSIGEIAQGVLQIIDNLDAYQDLIKEERLKAKMLIDDSSDKAGVDAARDAGIAALNAIGAPI